MRYIYKYLAVLLTALLLLCLTLPATAEAIVPPGQEAVIGAQDDQKGEEDAPDKEAADPAGVGELIQPNAGSNSGGSVVDPDDDYQGNVILPQEPEEDSDETDPEDDTDDAWSSAISTPVLTENGTVWISDSMTYDPNTHQYVYPIGDGEVRASVAHGMIVTNPVKIVGATLMIYKNGQLWEGDPLSISEPGEYVVMGLYGSQTLRLFTFTVAGSANNSIYAYTLPTGMIVTNATRNGEDTDYDRSTVPMQEDGLYHVEYESLSIAEARYALDINIDRTPPEIQFSGNIDENNRVHSALGFSGLQDGDTIQAKLDGEDIEVRVNPDGTGEFTESGSYIITVYDAAGNSTVYGYIVLLYMNASGLAFFAVLAASVAALLIYIYIKRKRLEIG